MSGEATDTAYLRELAESWRRVSYRNRIHKDRVLQDDDPGPHITAIQLEWAASEIASLRVRVDQADEAERDLAACREALRPFVERLWMRDEETWTDEERAARASLGGMTDDGPEGCPVSPIAKVRVHNFPDAALGTRCYCGEVILKGGLTDA